MKKNIFLFLSLTVMCLSLETLQAQYRQPSATWNVQEVTMIKWDLQDGLPYKEVPGANLGATSFQIMDDNKIAFLSNATSEVIITNNGKVVKKIPVAFAPRDFVYNNGVFVILNESLINVYSQQGSLVNKFPLPNFALGVERLACFNNSTYLLLPSGNSLKIESAGLPVEPKEFEGWVTSSGDFVATKITGDNSYSINVTTATGKSFEKTFNTNKKVAGVYVVGATANSVTLDIQKFTSEDPIGVEREIVSLELNKNGLSTIVTSIKVPDCYYVLSNKDFYVSTDGSIFNMVTSPEGAYVFSLTNSKLGNTQNYPTTLLATKYHFNDHLVQVEEK